jgi:hypothetical protein
MEDVASPRSDSGLTTMTTTTATAWPTRTRTHTRTHTDEDELFVDDEMLVYRPSGKDAVCTGGRHLVVVPSRHFESVDRLVSCSFHPTGWFCSVGQ